MSRSRRPPLRGGRGTARLWVACAAGFLAALSAAGAAPARAGTADPRINAGSIQAIVHQSPWSVAFTTPSGAGILSELSGGQVASGIGALAFSSAGAWSHATRVLTGRMDGGAYVATLATDDPLQRTVAVRVQPISDGVVEVSAQGPEQATQMAVGFSGRPGERFSGFGERSDAVIRAGGTVNDYVAEGPYQPVEEPAIAAFVPLAGYDPRPDATYFPIPWALSSLGYGVLVEGAEKVQFTLGAPWGFAVDGSRVSYRVYAGPRPADALRRFSADVGRQPAPATPSYFGPWWQPKDDPQANLRVLRAAGGGALGSVVQTYTHYLPCGSQQGQQASEQQNTGMFHSAGLAVTTYFNPMICTGYHPRYDEAAQAGLLTKNVLGQPYDYRYTGTSQFLVGQFDFTAPGAVPFYGDLLDEAVRNGYDGWMEDFGEYTPTDSVAHDGTPGPAMHNLYPVLYHGAAYAYAQQRAPRPLLRFNRSGWTGAARVSQAVWGGDPSTGFGFDGLQSAIANGLTMGLSGVSEWGSDIGGYFALSLPQTTPDLERRWIEFGFASGVMRTEATGYSLGSSPRAQIFDPGVLGVWARYAQLRTQLEPYLAAAARSYEQTGLPIMRQLMLAYPTDSRAAEQQDEYLFGPDILVAPVITANATTRTLYLPEGRWIDLWRSMRVDGGGVPRLLRPLVLDGGRDVTVAAPADQLPMFVRAGAAIGLLPADVQTLSSYGSGVVHMGDRDGVRTLLAWPGRGEPRGTTALADDARATSRTSSSGTWTLRLAQRRTRTIALQVALARRPCALTVDGRRVAFTYADGVLVATVRLAGGVVRAPAGCASRDARRPRTGA